VNKRDTTKAHYKNIEIFDEELSYLRVATIKESMSSSLRKEISNLEEQRKKSINYLIKSNPNFIILLNLLSPVCINVYEDCTCARCKLEAMIEENNFRYITDVIE
jgi:protein-disulfide isomerase